jgi:hypothetical protein
MMKVAIVVGSVKVAAIGQTPDHPCGSAACNPLPANRALRANQVVAFTNLQKCIDS